MWNKITIPLSISNCLPVLIKSLGSTTHLAQTYGPILADQLDKDLPG
jgi:hypothetical protein